MQQLHGGQVHIGLVSEYVREENGYRIVLDTGRSALIPLGNPVEERFLTGEFSDELFQRNYGVALSMGADGRIVWYPAQICAILMGASYRRDGRSLGMEHWTPDWSHDVPVFEDGSPALRDGTITVGLVGGTVAPYYLRGDSPGYARAGAILKEALAGMRINNAGETLRAGDSGRNMVEALRGKPGVSVHFARIDFAYTRGYEIIHVQKTTCVDQEYPVDA